MTTRIRRHATTVLAAAFLLAGALAACTPQPAPQPSPTGFASEEEAFAAAEATYRAYVDAVNARRADENSSPDPTDFLIGDALSASIETTRMLESNGLRLVGSSTIAGLHLAASTEQSATLNVCLDSRKSKVVNEEGVDVTPGTRADFNALEVVVVFSLPKPLVSESEASDKQCSG